MRDHDDGNDHCLPDEAFSEDEITTGMRYPARSHSIYRDTDIDDDPRLPDESFTGEEFAASDDENR